jgi:NAD(P)-dependent dehydrogenase (short-subunit alcohol dehydrogenase family)
MTNNPMDLTGKVAVITGGGQGIGLEIARTFASAGADIAIAELNPGTGQGTALEIERTGRRAVFIRMDVSDPDQVNLGMKAVVEDFGQIDILVNNAGIVDNVPATETSDESWRRVMDVNLNGVFWCCRAAAQTMIPLKKGVIVNIASMSGMIVNKPQPQTSYNVSKAGVIMLTKSLAAEWAEFGIRMNSVSPGYIGTELTKRGMSNTAWSGVWLENTPMGRIGEPSDVAMAALYLASEASGFATGTNLVIDGGYTIW